MEHIFHRSYTRSSERRKTGATVSRRIPARCTWPRNAGRQRYVPTEWLAFSPDGGTLYIDDSEQKNIRAFTLDRT